MTNTEIERRLGEIEEWQAKQRMLQRRIEDNLKEIKVNMKIQFHKFDDPTLTNKQQHVLNAISLYFSKFNMSPTLNEICELIGIKSRTGAFYLVNILKQKGYIDTFPGKNRNIILKKYS